MVILANAFSLQMLDLTQQTNIKITPITVDDVKRLLATGFISAIGHVDTANVLTDLLEINVPMNRVNVSLTKDTVLVVAQLVGGRLPEGVTKLPAGFNFSFVKVELI